jgi:serine/threonine protein phosphatase PrpC
MFAGLLDGSWTEHRWWSVSARIDPAFDRPVTESQPLRFESAAATDVGKTREINQDAFLERPSAGLWAVADGLGGHRDGEIASRMVCDALADFEPNTSFEDMVEGARQRIYEVNDHLLRASMRSRLPDRSGSTVVMLLLRGASCAVLWAGDSRVYRWRAGRLERLTHDHSVVESDMRAGRHEAHFVTRAVGVESKLTLDLHRDEVRAGDRFLLCSDGLTHTLPDSQIEVWLQNKDIRASVDGLIKATLDAGAPDNVTVLVVEACA